MVNRELHYVRDNSEVRNCDGLINQYNLICGHGNGGVSRTLGLPVVPLEKHRKASFVFASPASRRRSTYETGCLKPKLIISGTVLYGDPGTESKTITRSWGMPALVAASAAISREPG